MSSGTYTLVIERPEPATITFGAAGDVALAAGWYAYTGSAQGSGGFSRIDRHRRLATGEHEVRHWHVDFLLCEPGTRIADDVRSANVDIECAVARRLRERLDPVDALGASDCDCATHLHYAADRGRLTDAVRQAHDDARP